MYAFVTTQDFNMNRSVYNCTLKELFSLPCLRLALILKTTLEMRLQEKLYNSVLFLECQCLQCSAVQGSVQNVARRLGKCRSDRRMQIPCMVLIIDDVVFHVFLLLGFALVQSVHWLVLVQRLST